MDMEDAFRKGLIEEIDRDERLIEKELEESRKDLEKAEKDLEVEDYKWSIVSSYYSMFHITKAVMFENGYREKGHLAILVFLDYLIKEGRLRGKYKNYYKSAKRSRESADYSSVYSKERAEEVLGYASEYNSRLEELIRL
jgi:uncharacterized protein (UPF0332 family)